MKIFSIVKGSTSNDKLYNQIEKDLNPNGKTTQEQINQMEQVNNSIEIDNTGKKTN